MRIFLWPRRMLHGLQVHIIHDQVAGKGVAEVMESEIVDPRLATSRPEGTLHLVVGLALHIAKHMGRVQMSRESLQLFPQGQIHRNDFRFIILRVVNRDGARTKVNVLPRKPQHLAFPHACMQGLHDNRSEMGRTRGNKGIHFLSGEIAQASRRFF